MKGDTSNVVLSPLPQTATSHHHVPCLPPIRHSKCTLPGIESLLHHQGRPLIRDGHHHNVPILRPVSAPPRRTIEKHRPSASNITRTVSPSSHGGDGGSGGIPLHRVSYPSGSSLGPFVIERTLGQGSYGKVKLATHQSTKEKVALKFIHKSSIKKETHLTRIKREIRLLRLLSHPNIIRLMYTIETDSDIILVMEYADGGELLEHIQQCGRLTEPQARPLFRQIISAVAYLHSQCLIHRDLKPQNLLLNDNHTIVKLVDFGFANFYEPREHLSTFCGSPFYASPEMVSGTKYTGPEVDIWSLGVILYSMLTGTVPFNHENVKGLYARILMGQYDTPDYLSDAAKDLIAHMLIVDRHQRLTWSAMLDHAWVCPAEMPYPPDLYLPPRSRFAAKEPLDQRILHKLQDYHVNVSLAPMQILQGQEGRAMSIYRLLSEKLQSDAKEEDDDGAKRIIVPPPFSTDAATTHAKNMLTMEFSFKLNLQSPSKKQMVTASGFVIPERILNADETVSLFDMLIAAETPCCNATTTTSLNKPGDALPRHEHAPCSPHYHLASPSPSHISKPLPFSSGFHWGDMFRFGRGGGGHSNAPHRHEKKMTSLK